ncbi:MAG: hypothetical protein FJ285_08100 [Planctomycetes bacterium]|nr:hypothetical protein [Planctomycetota bacterium]
MAPAVEMAAVDFALWEFAMRAGVLWVGVKQIPRPAQGASGHRVLQGVLVLLLLPMYQSFDPHSFVVRFVLLVCE